MDERVINDQCRKGKSELVIVCPFHGRNEVGCIEESVLHPAHEGIFPAGAAQEALESLVVNQFLTAYFIGVGLESAAVRSMSIDIHVHKLSQLPVFRRLGTAVCYLPDVMGTVCVDRYTAIITIRLSGFKTVDHSFNYRLLGWGELHDKTSSPSPKKRDVETTRR
jgi:hypothetical protein